MERLPLLGDDVASAELQATFARATARVGFVPNLYRTLAHAPDLLERWIDFAWALRDDASTGVYLFVDARGLIERCVSWSSCAPPS